MFLEVGLRFLLLKLLNKNKGMITDVFKVSFVTCNKYIKQTLVTL